MMVQEHLMSVILGESQMSFFEVTFTYRNVSYRRFLTSK